MAELLDGGAFESRYTLEDDERRAGIARGEGEAIRQEVELRRDRYWARISKWLAHSPHPVNQREIDYKRGFWNGAVYAVTFLPAEAKSALKAESTKGDDS